MRNSMTVQGGGDRGRQRVRDVDRGHRGRLLCLTVCCLLLRLLLAFPPAGIIYWILTARNR
jgi:hypothetical protein